MYQHLFDYHHLKCNKENFLQATSSEQQCYIAEQKCSDEYLYMNYSTLTYCWLDGSIFTTLILSAFVGYLVYNCISEVIKEYLIPSLESVKTKYNISEVMAGVTLLAFGNGAGDVLTALVASSYPGGLDYNIGATMGAGFFLCSIGVYLIVSRSKDPIKMNPTHIWRNLGFQIISIFVIMFFGVIGQISVFSSIMLTFLYTILVSLVYYQERSKILQQKKGNLTERTQTAQEAKYDLEKAQLFDDMKLLYLWENKTVQEQTAKIQKWGDPLNRLNYVQGDARIKLLSKKFRSAVQLTIAKIDNNKKKWERLSFGEKIREILLYPPFFIFKYTIPPCKEDEFSKNHAIIFPIPAITLFVSVVLSFPAWWVYFLALMIGFGASIIINTTVPSEKTPPKYFFQLQLIAIILSLVWIFFLSGLLLDFIQFWAMITQLNKTYLGFSVIAGGNVLPDCITLIQLAEEGYAIMALNGIYFGQLFTNLIGFSIAFLKQNYINWGAIDFQLFNILKIEENAFKLIVILGALANLIITLMLAVRSHYIITKFMGQLLSSLYVIFFLIATISAVYHAWKQ